MEIRTNHMIVITPKMNLLQIPIVDKYFVAPSDPTSKERAPEFAAAKGLLSGRRPTSQECPEVSEQSKVSDYAETLSKPLEASPPVLTV